MCRQTFCAETAHPVETNIYDDAPSLTYMEASCSLLESRLEAHPKGLNNNDIGNVLNTP